MDTGKFLNTVSSNEKALIVPYSSTGIYMLWNLIFMGTMTLDQTHIYCFSLVLTSVRFPFPFLLRQPKGLFTFAKACK